MGLIEIEYGSLASSKDINNNFQYLASELSLLAEDITMNTAGFSSKVATLNESVNSVMSLRNSFVQVGMITVTLDDTIPEGYLLCDGSEVAVEDFEDLYNVIGTTYGSNDSTTFCLPDLRDKTLWGVGTSTLGTYLTSKLPNIKGQFRLVGTEGSSAVSGAFKAGKKGGSYGKGHDSSSSNPLMQFDASLYNVETTVYSDDCTIVQPPALVANFIIKY